MERRTLEAGPLWVLNAEAPSATRLLVSRPLHVLPIFDMALYDMQSQIEKPGLYPRGILAARSPCAPDGAVQT